VIALAGAYVVWRLVRRLVPLLLIAGLAILLLAPTRQLPAPVRQLRREARVELNRAEQTVSRALETELRR